MTKKSLMKVFDFDNYRDYILQYRQALPKNGRGYFSKIASELNVHSTMISHIFSGDKSLSMEHALKLTNMLGLNKLETDYFMLLAQLDKSGTDDLTNYIKSQLSILKREADKVGSRLPSSKILDSKDKALYYSSWIYSAIRLLSSLGKVNTEEELLELIDVPQNRKREVLLFLLQKGLVKKLMIELLLAQLIYI